MKAVQKFSKEYLEECKKMSVVEIARFLEDFRMLHGETMNAGMSQLISMKIPKPLLEAFKSQCRLKGLRYQTQIKVLMGAWLKK